MTYDGIEEAYNILYNNCFITYRDHYFSPVLDPEEILIRTETVYGRDRISPRAQKLIEFSMKEYPKHNLPPGKIFELARKEMKWTVKMLRQAIIEVKKYVQSI